MDIKHFFHIIFKRAWILLALPVLTVGVTAYVNIYMVKPAYDSDTTLYVINKTLGLQTGVAYNDLLVNQQLVKDYRELIKSRSVTKTVIEKLKLKDITSEELAKKVSVNRKNDTQVIQIIVRDNDPKLARDLANAITEVFMDKVMALMKVENVSIVDYAEVPVKPVNASLLLVVLIALLTSLPAAISIILLVEYMDNTIKVPEDVTKNLDLPVLGTIPMLNMR